MISIHLKDGSQRRYDHEISGKDLANDISVSLGKKAVLCKVNGVVQDLSALIPDGASVEILTRESPDVLEVLRHSSAHVLAKAVTELFPAAQLAVGPATEDGFFYDFAVEEPFVPEDWEKIEASIKDIIHRDLPFERQVWTRQDALAFFHKHNEPFKVKILEDLEAETVSVYKIVDAQHGDLYDLCRGPHLPSTKFIGDAVKILKTAGAYWKGDKNEAPLQRVYGTVWPTQEELDTFFRRREEAEKRDHRKIGAELDLFHMQDLSPGAVFWHTKGWTLYRTLRNFVRERIEADGYKEVNTPTIVDRILWEKSGHWEKFRENMFVTELEDGRTMAIKPMNCPCHVQIFNQKLVSYKDLPWRMAEFGSCHRYEPSGALHGLMRVRGFVQDDAHIFCTPQQIVSETRRFCELLRGIYHTLGFDTFFVKFSDRPAKRAGSDEVWDLAESSLMQASREAGLDFTLNSGEGAFYGPKLEFVLKDCLGRDWQCGTLQLDFVLPERLGATYIQEDGSKAHPVMLHRAVLGSLERFIGILIEHYAGKFPTWLAPVQVVVATITEEANGFAEGLLQRLRQEGIRAEVDVRNEKISYKIREHSLQKIPYIFVVGKKEMAEDKVAIRQLGTEEQQVVSVSEAINILQQDICQGRGNPLCTAA